MSLIKESPHLVLLGADGAQQVNPHNGYLSIADDLKFTEQARTTVPKLTLSVSLTFSDLYTGFK